MSETFDAYVLEEQGPAVLKKLSDKDLPAGTLDAITSIRGFRELPDLAEQILAGATQSRIVIDCGR